MCIYWYLSHSPAVNDSLAFAWLAVQSRGFTDWWWWKFTGLSGPDHDPYCAAVVLKPSCRKSTTTPISHFTLWGLAWRCAVSYRDKLRFSHVISDYWWHMKSRVCCRWAVFHLQTSDMLGLPTLTLSYQRMSCFEGMGMNWIEKYIYSKPSQIM